MQYHFTNFLIVEFPDTFEGAKVVCRVRFKVIWATIPDLKFERKKTRPRTQKIFVPLHMTKNQFIDLVSRELSKRYKINTTKFDMRFKEFFPFSDLNGGLR